MEHREKLYSTFKIEFNHGLREIADIEKQALRPRIRNQIVNSICAVAIERLSETEFGHKLVKDEDLTLITLDLEHGLSKVVDKMLRGLRSECRSEALQWADECAEERHFKFLGGMGRIFNYFRDGPYFLDTKSEIGQMRDSASDSQNPSCGYITAVQPITPMV